MKTAVRPVIVCSLSLLVATGAASSVFAKQSTGGPLAISAELEAVLDGGLPKSVDDLRLVQEQVRRVVAAARPVTVAIELSDSVGSGVIISAEGLVLTAGHVSVEPNRELRVRFPDGRRVKGRSLGVNHRLDSGLIQITDPPTVPEDESSDAESDSEGPAKVAEGWPFVPLAEGEPEEGDWVIGLGQPNGFVQGRAPPVRLGRVLTTSDDSLNTDVTLVGGDSGGPLLNLRGEVVGIHSKIGESITSNYHVPVGSYRREWEELLAGKMTGLPEDQDPADWRPLVGMAVREVDGELVVTQVFPDKSADDAGVKVGDVVLRFDGRAVATTAEIDRAVRRQEAYSRVPLVVRRDAETVELEVWIGRTLRGFPGSRPAEDSP
ncbi:MAG: trypsin-like peptidase domain-containing protein [Planctomycetota bacterium]